MSYNKGNVLIFEPSGFWIFVEIIKRIIIRDVGFERDDDASSFVSSFVVKETFYLDACGLGRTLARAVNQRKSSSSILDIGERQPFLCHCVRTKGNVLTVTEVGG